MITTDRRTAQRKDYFLMANLSPIFTGLPWVVWILVKGNTRHDIRVKVSPKKGNMIPVALRPTLRVIGQHKLDPRGLRVLEAWVQLNWDALLSYWNGELFTEEVIERLKKV